jgi:1,4-dihydroxy-2-naphthoate octaprenyltransferase
MKRPIDIEHANKWLIGFSIASFVFAIVFFVSGIIPGGIALLVVAIVLLIPQIAKTIRQNQPESDYSIRNRKIREHKERLIEEAIRQNSSKENKED